MLVANNTGVAADPGITKETEILSWVADGQEFFLGFMATGTYSGMFKLYVKLPQIGGNVTQEICYYLYQTSPSNRTAYVVDRITKYDSGTKISLRVSHDSANTETFYGTLLGGAN